MASKTEANHVMKYSWCQTEEDYSKVILNLCCQFLLSFALVALTVIILIAFSRVFAIYVLHVYF